MIFSKYVFFTHLLKTPIEVKKKCAKNPFMQFHVALTRILTPLVRSMIAHGVTFPDLSDLLKPIFVRCAETNFGLEGKRMTDSRVSLLTGLQRRDVRAHRDQGVDAEQTAEGAGPLPRIIARWQSDETWCDGDTPHVLSRAGEGLSFEALVNSISRDMHPRTLLDELERQGVVAIDADQITLLTDSYLPTSDDAKLGYFAANLADHVEAAVTNLTEKTAPFFERAVHYNQLSNQSLKALETLARERQHAVMKELNAEANRLQRIDKKNARANGRLRFGAFIYLEKSEGKSP